MSIENLTEFSSKDEKTYQFDVVVDDDGMDLQYSFIPSESRIERLKNYSDFINKMKTMTYKDVSKAKYYRLIEDMYMLLEQYKSGEKSVDNTFTAEDFVILDENFGKVIVEVKELKNKKRH